MQRDGRITAARAVARGTVDAVLALPGVCQRGEMMLHNHPSGRLEPSGADLHVAARLHDAGVGFGIIDNDAERLYVVVEVPRASATERVDSFDVAAMLGEKGPVARVLGRYEDRPSQRDMAAYIADAYNDGGVLLLEAGTGVGKSFAYLVPALAWARRNGERTIVSTNTINLQEQLVGKDLPLLRAALSDETYTPTFAMLKGWRNYLCLARLDLAVLAQKSLLEAEKQEELTGIAQWAGHSADGSLADLPVMPSPEVWDEVSAESDLCPRLKCSHFERCFLFKARRKAAEADIVVVNHHLLAADLAVRHESDNWEDAAVLPPYRRLILDEAHHLEDVAAKHLGVQVSSRGVRRLLSRFERQGRGLVPALRQLLTQQDDLLARASADLLTQRVVPALTEAKRASDALFLRLHGRMEETPAGQLRCDGDFASEPIWTDGLDRELDAVLATFRQLRGHVETIADRLEQDEMTDQRLRLLAELRGVMNRLERTGEGLARALRPASTVPEVRWMERSGRKGQDVALATAPLDLAPVLRELLFEKVETIILTSATLATGGSFDFIEQRVGLAGSGLVTAHETFASPFDYGEQCLFGIPDDLPDPRADEALHSAAIQAIVGDVAMACDGGMFVLFTSYAALKRTAEGLRSSLGGRFPLLVQGEAPRDQLLQRFKDSGRAILLGTDSFWEGVDVPGRALRALVLTKVPFKVPSEPVTAARLERLAEAGEDGFSGYLLPHAGLKLKQGFGRLIRSGDDAGIVLLLDGRVLTKRYGQSLIDGLPRAEYVTGSWKQVRTRCEDFFARHGIGATA